MFDVSLAWGRAVTGCLDLSMMTTSPRSSPGSLTSVAHADTEAAWLAPAARAGSHASTRHSSTWLRLREPAAQPSLQLGKPERPQRAHQACAARRYFGRQLTDGPARRCSQLLEQLQVHPHRLASPPHRDDAAADASRSARRRISAGRRCRFAEVAVWVARELPRCATGCGFRSGIASIVLSCGIPRSTGTAAVIGPPSSSPRFEPTRTDITRTRVNLEAARGVGPANATVPRLPDRARPARAAPADRAAAPPAVHSRPGDKGRVPDALIENPTEGARRRRAGQETSSTPHSLWTMCSRRLTTDPGGGAAPRSASRSHSPPASPQRGSRAVTGRQDRAEPPASDPRRRARASRVRCVRPRKHLGLAPGRD